MKISIHGYFSWFWKAKAIFCQKIIALWQYRFISISQYCLQKLLVCRGPYNDNFFILDLDILFCTSMFPVSFFLNLLFFQSIFFLRIWAKAKNSNSISFNRLFYKSFFYKEITLMGCHIFSRVKILFQFNFCWNIKSFFGAKKIVKTFIDSS